MEEEAGTERRYVIGEVFHDESNCKFVFEYTLREREFVEDFKFEQPHEELELFTELWVCPDDVRSNNQKWTVTHGCQAAFVHIKYCLNHEEQQQYEYEYEYQYQYEYEYQ